MARNDLAAQRRRMLKRLGFPTTWDPIKAAKEMRRNWQKQELSFAAKWMPEWMYDIYKKSFEIGF